MKLFTEMDTHSWDADALAVENSLYSVDADIVEMNELVSGYEAAQEAQQALSRVENSRVTDQNVHRIVMESINDQLGYPEGTRLSSEGIGGKIATFAKRVWQKIKMLWHRIKLFFKRMVDRFTSFARGEGMSNVIAFWEGGAEKAIPEDSMIVAADRPEAMAAMSAFLEGSLKEVVWVPSKEDTSSYSASGPLIEEAVRDKGDLSAVECLVGSYTINEGVVTIEDKQVEGTTYTPVEMLKAVGHLTPFSLYPQALNDYLEESGEKSGDAFVQGEYGKIMRLQSKLLDQLQPAIEMAVVYIVVARNMIHANKTGEIREMDKEAITHGAATRI